jgi:hypothetical protein
MGREQGQLYFEVECVAPELYIPIAATVVTHRLRGTAMPPELELARRFPCMECGAPVGFACRETSERCWRARLLTNKQWRAIQKARLGGLGAPGGFLDEIYQGFGRMGQMHDDHEGAQNAMRRLRTGQDGKAVVEMIKAVLDARGDIPF